MRSACPSYSRISRTERYRTSSCSTDLSGRWCTLSSLTCTITRFWPISKERRSRTGMNSTSRRTLNSKQRPTPVVSWWWPESLVLIVNPFPFSFRAGSNSGSVQTSKASSGSYVPARDKMGARGQGSASNGGGAGSQSGSAVAIPEIKIREWVWTSANPYRHPEMVSAVPVGWPVPTIHRLWFGTSLGKQMICSFSQTVATKL